MQEKLIELTVGKLLTKFGAGNHKPGSGSAVAFQGMLSAQLLRTVISLTNDSVRQHKYLNSLTELLKIDNDIEKQILPELERLFQEDSVQFDKVIKLRWAHKKEKDLMRKSQRAMEALQELKAATEIPIKIATLCIKLAEYAAIVFDNAFKAARGDSSVALNSAVSSLGGCLTIIDLNLLSFQRDEWTEKIRSEANHLRSRYNLLYSETTLRQEILKKEAEKTNDFYTEIDALLSFIQAKSKLSNLEVEEIVRQLQLIIWRYQSLIWKRDKPENPIDLLKPDFILRRMGYQFQKLPSIETNEVQGDLEIAGLIDKEKKVVSISQQFPLETQNFTAAHELGHALLHKQIILHRDKALDGSPVSSPRNTEELQADKFASYFLMPKKQVEKRFQELFLAKLSINEDTAFGLNISIGELKKTCKNLRDLSRLIASTEFFLSKPFLSLSKQFHVSIEAMAIRLEELDLIEF